MGFRDKKPVWLIGILILLVGLSAGEIRITDSSIQKNGQHSFWHEGIFQKSNYLPLDGSSEMQGNLNLSGNRLTNVPAPAASSDAVNKSYVDNNDDTIADDQTLSEVLGQDNSTGSYDIDMNGNSITAGLTQKIIMGIDRPGFGVYGPDHSSRPGDIRIWYGDDGSSGGTGSFRLYQDYGGTKLIMKAVNSNIQIPNGNLNLKGNALLNAHPPCNKGDSNWIWNDHCYMYFKSSYSTIESAQTKCHSINSHMVSVGYSSENTEIDSRVGNIWLAQDQDHDNDYTDSYWDGGEQIAYTNWASGEPNNADSEQCAEMYSDGVWNDMPCDSRDEYLVCERELY